MKNLAFILICLTFLLSCKDEKTNVTSESNTNKTETKKSSVKIEDFDCATFFKKGDYSSMCFTDAKLPENINRGCIFDFVTKGNKQEEKLLLQFTNKNSAMLAEMHLNLNKSSSKKGKITAVSNLGDDAFFVIHGTDLKSLSRSNKDLYVRHSNIVFVIMTEYLSNKGEPCFYDDKDLITFAQLIIQNL
jgi:hypothetical protein